MKKARSVELPTVVSVRFSEVEYRHLLLLAQTGRRTLSQTVRILMETALRESKT